MKYRAHIRLDFDHQNPNDYQKLIAALLDIGWKYVQTSSLSVETDDLLVVLRAFELLARQIPSAGSLTGLLLDVQGSANFSGIQYTAASNHPNAVAQIRGKPLP
jgi:Tfp pilus assembly protein PilO